MQRQIAILLSLIFLASCGGDDPVTPSDNLDENLVGTWAFDSTDMVDVMVGGVAKFMSDAGADQDDIDAVISEIRTDLRDTSMIRLTVRFNADGSFENDQGNRGAWRVESNILITVEDGDEERIKYFVDGDDLTLIYSSEFVLNSLREDEDFTDLEVALFREVFDFDEDTNVRFFFKRR